ALRLAFRVNEYHEIKKRNNKKAGTYVNHIKVLPCFTKAVRGHEMKEHIINIKNGDNLCFLYYIINNKFFSYVKQHEKYEHRFTRMYDPIPEDFEKAFPYYLSMLPLIRYPIQSFNEESQRILEKYFPDIKDKDINE